MHTKEMGEVLCCHPATIVRYLDTFASEHNRNLNSRGHHWINVLKAVDDIFPYDGGLAFERCGRSQEVPSDMGSHLKLLLNNHDVPSLLKSAMRWSRKGP